MTEEKEVAILTLLTPDLLGTIILAATSIYGIRRFSKELHYKSIMNGISERINRIHEKNKAVSDFCSFNMNILIKKSNITDESAFLTQEDLDFSKNLMEELLKHAMGSSRSIETYCTILYNTVDSIKIKTKKNNIRTIQILSLLFATLEIIQDHANKIIETPKKIEIKKDSSVKKELTKYTSSKGYNTTPYIESGPITKDTTDEALIFFSSCLYKNFSSFQIEPFESFFNFVGGNHPIVLMMINQKLVFPHEISFGKDQMLGRDLTFQAVHITFSRKLSQEKESNETRIIYCNSSNFIKLSLKNYKDLDFEKLISKFDIVKTPKIEIEKSNIKSCRILDENQIELCFDNEIGENAYKRNKKEVELFLLRKSGNLTPYSRALTELSNFFAYKV